jgi:predicted nucleotidyltransferase
MPKKGKKSRKRAKYHTDEQGHYVWDNYFVGGKQRRSKRRVTVIDGEIIDDSDEWLLANADDPFLIDCERWDLVGRRMLGEEAPQSGEPAMKPPPRNLHLDILELESVFELLAAAVVPDDDDEPCFSFLDLTTGKIVTPEDEEESEALWGDKNLLVLPAHLFEDLFYGSLDEFVVSLPVGSQRTELARAIRGKGAFRRFKDIVLGGGNVELKHRWQWFETCRKRERIVQWLRDENIEPEWGSDIFEAPSLPDKRGDLLRAVLAFVKDSRHLPGVRRIALLGSLATPKAIPKDVDLLVEVADDMPLDGLARLKRQLLGKTMQTGDSCGADIFLCNPQGEYIGRICSWKTCAPGIRQGCRAQHCGRRSYLSDDLQNVHLDAALVAEPPLELWPGIIARIELPDDVRDELVTPIQRTPGDGHQRGGTRT